MNFAIMRLRNLTLRKAAAMGRHALREVNTPNADPDLFQENSIVIGPRTSLEMMKIIKERTNNLMERKNMIRCMEFMITGSPEAIHKMTKSEQDRYFIHSLEWIGRYFGGLNNIVLAVVHRDETTPHLQVFIVPILNGFLRASKLVGGIKGLSALQDTFAAEVGAPSKLRRGIKGSKARHSSVKAYYAWINKLGKTDELPKYVRVPKAPLPPKPGEYEDEQQKANRLRLEKLREQAIKHNEETGRVLRGFAEMALTVFGRSSRMSQDKLNEKKAIIAQAEEAKILIKKAQEMLNRLSAEQAEEAIRLMRLEMEKQKKLEAEQKPVSDTSTSRLPKPDVDGSIRKPSGPRP